MTALRLISLPFHGALELIIGSSLMLLPFVLGFGPAGTLVSVAVGALVVGLALSAAVAEDATFDVGAHHAYDIGLAVGLVGAGLVLAVAGDGPAAVTLLAAATLQLTLNLSTRYSLGR